MVDEDLDAIRREPLEFSREIRLSEIARGGRTIKIEATPEERARVAKRLGAPEIQLLSGNATILVTKSTISVTGGLKAEMTRECVASLELMPEKIEEEFEIEFLRSQPAGREEGDSDHDWNLPEVHESDVLDIGELVVQQVALAMNPFPRREDAPGLVEIYGRQEERSPFAVLAGEVENDKENQ